MDNWPDEPMESSHNALVLGQGRWGHVMVAINKFMPFPIVGKSQVLLIGEF